MEDLMMALIWLGFFAAIFLGWYFFIQARNKERMALIERDKDVSEIYAKQQIIIRFPWLKLGTLITGVGFGLGLVTCILLVAFNDPKDIDDDIVGILFATAGMFFGGLGIIIGYYLDKPKK